MRTKATKKSAARLMTHDSNGEWTHDDIAFAAFCLWEDAGQPQGRELEHWFHAESLLRQARERNQLQA